MNNIELMDTITGQTLLYRYGKLDIGNPQTIKHSGEMLYPSLAELASIMRVDHIKLEYDLIKYDIVSHNGFKVRIPQIDLLKALCRRKEAIIMKDYITAETIIVEDIIKASQYTHNIPCSLILQQLIDYYTGYMPEYLKSIIDHYEQESTIQANLIYGYNPKLTPQYMLSGYVFKYFSDTDPSWPDISIDQARASRRFYMEGYNHSRWKFK